MKRTLVVSYFIILLVALYCFFSMPNQNYRNGFTKLDLAEAQSAALVQVWNLLRFSPVTHDVAYYFASKANLPTFSGFIFANCKQMPPVWERGRLFRPIGYGFWFFIALMIISLFFRFYQSSRTNSESGYAF